jgi:hypothetical protein
VNKDSINQLPKARKAKLIVKELEGETLVYDLEADKAHCLNETAARIWKHCDGNNGVGEIAKLVADETKAELDARIVWLALDQLEKFSLLEAVPERPAFLAGLNRRQLIRDAGLAALALPVIMSIASPAPGQAASPCQSTTPNSRPPGCPCTNPSQCSNGAGAGCSSGICL